MWEWGLGINFRPLSPTQGPRNKSLPKARIGRESGLSVISRLWLFLFFFFSPCRLFPQWPQGVFLALRMGNPALGLSAGRVGRLARLPLHGLRARRPAGVPPPLLGGFIQSQTTSALSPHAPDGRLVFQDLLLLHLSLWSNQRTVSRDKNSGQTYSRRSINAFQMNDNVAVSCSEAWERRRRLG